MEIIDTLTSIIRLSPLISLEVAFATLFLASTLTPYR
jgi:hypothetical protein